MAFTKAVLAVLFLLIVVLPQSFKEIKLPFLGYLLLMTAYLAFKGRLQLRSRAAVLFYLFFSLPVLWWCLIGALYGNEGQAIVEGLTVYVLYMWMYAFVVFLVSNLNYEPALPRFFSIAAVGIALFAFTLLAEVLLGRSLVPEFVKEQMYLQVGVHIGFFQMNNVNVGMYCFVLPFLVSAAVLKAPGTSKWTYLAIAVSVLAVVLASRRIVYVLIVLTPLLAFVIAVAMGQSPRSIGKRMLASYGVLLAIGVLGLLALYEFNVFAFDGFIDRVAAIFSSDPSTVRHTQHSALMEAFQRSPFMGSGFGGVTESVRSYDRPWTYELTYSKIIFNSGVLGVACLGGLFSIYFVLAVLKARGETQFRPIYASLLVGFLSVAIAAASNPYLSSFDFVFVLSIIPLILNSDIGHERAT